MLHKPVLVRGVLPEGRLEIGDGVVDLFSLFDLEIALLLLVWFLEPDEHVCTCHGIK